MNGSKSWKGMEGKIGLVEANRSEHEVKRSEWKGKNWVYGSAKKRTMKVEKNGLKGNEWK